MLIFGSNMHIINETKKLLPTHFEMKGMGEANVILENKIRKTNDSFSYTVSRLSCYTHNHSKEHWGALYRLLRYSRGTMDWFLHFSKFPAMLEGFCDVNFVSDNDEASSTSSYALP